MEQLTSNFPVVLPIQGMENKKIEARVNNLLCQDDDFRPLIAGEFTDFKPERMLRVDEFARMIDTKSQLNKE